MTLKHRLKLSIAKVKWFFEAVDVVIRNKNSKFEKIYNKRKELRERFLTLDKDYHKETDPEYYKVLGEYNLINQIIEWLKE